MTTTYSGLEVFQRAKLKLLDRALRPAKFPRNFFNGFLFDESFDQDRSLIFRKTVHELKQRGAALDVAPARLVEIVSQLRIDGLSRPTPPIPYDIRSNPEEPHCKRHTSPFEV